MVLRFLPVGDNIRNIPSLLHVISSSSFVPEKYDNLAAARRVFYSLLLEKGKGGRGSCSNPATAAERDLLTNERSIPRGILGVFTHDLVTVVTFSETWKLRLCC